jgi:integrase
LENPVKACRKPKLSRGRDRRLMPGEERALLEYCQKAGNDRLALVIVLAVETAMRRSELVRGLKWEDVDLGRLLAYLRDTTNGESRTVPLSTKATTVLKEAQGTPRGFILDVYPDVITHDFVEACKQCGIEDLRTDFC